MRSSITIRRRVADAGAGSTDRQRRPGGRFGRHQVAELPPISVVWTEHRTHQLRCRHCRARTSARLPERDRLLCVRAEVAGGDGDVDGPASDLAPRDLRARARSVRRHALDRRGGRDLPARLRRIGWPASASCRTGCWTRARCMSMRPAGARAVRAVRCGPRPPLEATFLQIAEHCNREQFNALIGTCYPGIVVSDRWNGYSHLDPHQRQVCWSHLQRDFRRHADGLAEQKTFGEQGLELTRRVFAAWRAYQHEHHDRDRLAGRDRADPDRATRSCSSTPRPRADAPAGTGSSPTTCSRSGPRSGRSSPSTGSSPPTTRPNARSAHPSSTAKSRSAPKATTVSDSPNARSRPPPPAACSAAHYSPTSANYSSPTPAATRSPRSPEAPGTERLRKTPPLRGFS